MIKGSLVPNITIFDRDGSVNEDKTRQHIEWMFNRGLDGLFLTGSYGAGPLMSVDERIRIVEIARSVANGFEDKILLPHVGAIRTDEAVTIAKAVEEIGVDGVGAVPPFYYKHSEDVVKQYYLDLINAVDVPVFAYNNPATSRFTFSYSLVEQLRAAGLAGLKDSPLNIGFLSRIAYENQVAGNEFQIIIGTSTGWLPLYHMGVRATIAGMNNWAPEIMTELVRSTNAGEYERAALAYAVMSDLSKQMHFADSTIVSHVGLYARGFDAGYPRKPMILPEKDDPVYKKVGGIIQSGFDRLDMTMES